MNARRAGAGRGAEGKKARWTGHARPKPKMDGGLAALGAFEYDSQQFRGRPPHAASHRSTFIVASVSRPSTFFPSALSPPLETVARRRETCSPRPLRAVLERRPTSLLCRGRGSVRATTAASFCWKHHWIERLPRRDGWARTSTGSNRRCSAPTDADVDRGLPTDSELGRMPTWLVAGRCPSTVRRH